MASTGLDPPHGPATLQRTGKAGTPVRGCHRLPAASAEDGFGRDRQEAATLLDALKAGDEAVSFSLHDAKREKAVIKFYVADWAAGDNACSSGEYRRPREVRRSALRNAQVAKRRRSTYWNRAVRARGSGPASRLGLSQVRSRSCGSEAAGVASAMPKSEFPGARIHEQVGYIASARGLVSDDVTAFPRRYEAEIREAAPFDRSPSFWWPSGESGTPRPRAR